MGTPDDYDHMEAQFKYGSIGADHPLAQAPLPYWLWKVLPDVLPPVGLLAPPLGPSNERKGYEAFGLVIEAQPERPTGHVAGQPAFERPIGFSKRRVLGMDFVGLNCAFCHLGTYQADDKAPRQVVLGGTGNAVDIEQYFLYLFAAMTSQPLHADTVMPAVERELQRQQATLPAWQRLLYRHVVIPVLPYYLSWMQQAKFDFIYPHNPARLPEFGPGRVDTWGLYKRVFVDPPQHDDVPGTSDFPVAVEPAGPRGHAHALGRQHRRADRAQHRFGAVAGRPAHRVPGLRPPDAGDDWIVGLLPPRYADRFPDSLRARAARPSTAPSACVGSPCSTSTARAATAAPGDRVGRVEPITDLGTDPERIAEFTPELARALNRLGTDRWQLRHFRVENGYVNMPLDGIWLRAPYLHNGSVPTLRDLLNPPERRPQVFCRGGEVYDWQNLGYLTPAPSGSGSDACRSLFRYDTTVARQRQWRPPLRHHAERRRQVGAAGVHEDAVNRQGPCPGAIADRPESRHQRHGPHRALALRAAMGAPPSGPPTTRARQPPGGGAPQRTEGRRRGDRAPAGVRQRAGPLARRHRAPRATTRSASTAAGWASRRMPAPARSPGATWAWTWCSNAPASS
jgi:hypothetical protein